MITPNAKELPNPAVMSTPDHPMVADVADPLADLVSHRPVATFAALGLEAAAYAGDEERDAHVVVERDSVEWVRIS